MIVGQVRAISVDGRKLLFCVDNLHVPLHELRDGGFELVKVDLLIVAASTGIERVPLKSRAEARQVTLEVRG